MKASGESPKALNIPLVNDEGGSRFEVSLVEEGEKGGGQRRALSQGSGEPGRERQSPGKHDARGDKEPRGAGPAAEPAPGQAVPRGRGIWEGVLQEARGQQA